MRAIRAEHKGCGGYKLWLQLQQSGVQMGRDAFYRLLAQNGLLLKKKRRKAPRTTQPDYEGARALPDRYNPTQPGEPRKQPQAPDRVWVADLTYLPLGPCHWAYLSLITDAHTREIVGWSLQQTLETEGPMQALQQAVESRRPQPGLIFHSDRGAQYLSKQHQQALSDLQAKQSVTQTYDPRKNALAERVNGIIKNEYQHTPTDDLNKLRQCLEKNIHHYNTKRPHANLEYLTPNEFKALQRKKQTLNSNA